MEVYLIRHTSPEISEGLIYGRMDVPLSATFKEEIASVKNQLPLHLERVYSSPSSRCIQLASAITEKYSADERLLELNFGWWEGKTWNTINRQDSEFWMADYLNRRPPEGESYQEMIQRVLSFWQDLQASVSQTVVIVTHAGVIRILLAHLNKQSYHSAFNRKINYGEVFRLNL